MPGDTLSVQIFGNFIEELQPGREYLTIGFSPSHLSLKKRWENNGLSADFIADYFKNFYVSKREEANGGADEVQTENLRNAVKYIANELLENAMKFQNECIPYVASIAFSLYTDKLVFQVSNGIGKDQVAGFQAYIRQLLEGDPDALYFDAMRNSALAENAGHSRLGLLSMMCDYSAKLGWKFEPVPHPADILIVHTMVMLDT